MKLKIVELYKVSMDMNFEFTSSKASIDSRETIIIKVIDYHGDYGYGEVVCFKEPFYTNETIDMSLKVLEEQYIGEILKSDIKSPFEIHKIIDKKYPMTKAAIESALIDLYCRKNNIKAMDFLFLNEEPLREIKGGMVLGDMPYEDLADNIKRFVNEGYVRFKLKVKPKESLSKIKRIRKEFPDIKLLLDANRSFSLSDMEELIEYDNLNLLCIEEPIEYRDLKELALIQSKLRTPICLDEGILTIDKLKEAISLKAFKILNIKAARLGGIYYAKEAIKLCRENNINFWMGSMVETSIGKMIQVNLASIADNYMEGDLSSNSRYFKDDLINPPLEFKNGVYTLSDSISFGYDIQEEKLKKHSVHFSKREV